MVVTAQVQFLMLRVSHEVLSVLLYRLSAQLCWAVCHVQASAQLLQIRYPLQGQECHNHGSASHYHYDLRYKVLCYLQLDHLTQLIFLA